MTSISSGGLVTRQSTTTSCPQALPPRGTRRRISAQLDRFASDTYLVEKTVANTLRVPFVYALFPEARFVHLVRDGVDVVSSSRTAWLQRPDWRYLYRKLRSFPPTVAPRYLSRYALETAQRQLSRGRVPVWGPRYSGIEADTVERGVLVACAEQWRRSVEAALQGLRVVPADQQLEVRYESFVSDANRELGRIAQFCGLEHADICSPPMTVRTDRLGRGREDLSEPELATVLSIIAPVLEVMGYDS